MPIMPPPIEKPRPESSLDNDFHPATITLVKPVMDPATNTFALNDGHKTMIDFRFQLDELDDEGNPIVLYRNKMAVSYGQYAGKWADYAQLIEAALGVVAGDKAQHNIDTDDLLNKRIRVQTAKVASAKGDGKVYTNCVGYAAPKKARPAPVFESEAARARMADAIAQSAPVHAPAAAVGLTHEDLDSLPF